MEDPGQDRMPTEAAVKGSFSIDLSRRVGDAE